MSTTIRERMSERLLHKGIELGAEREQLLRSVRASAPDEREYQRAAGQLLGAQCLDGLLRWLAVRVRPRSAPHHQEGPSA